MMEQDGEHEIDITGDPQPSNGSLDRRTFLASATVLTTGLIISNAVAVPIVSPSSTITQAALMKIASFLTGKSDLPIEMVKRAYDALVIEDPTFPSRLKALIEGIRTAELSDVEAFRTSPLAADADHMKTAVAVISALYTGRVGKGYRGHFVAYKEALMFRPTSDVTVIPTYADRSLGYWTEPVKS